MRGVGILVILLLLVGLALCALVLVRSEQVRWAFLAPGEKARVLFKNKLYDEAIANFEAVLRTQPENVAALSGLAHCYLKKGDLASAAGWAERATEHDGTAGSWVLLAEVHLAMAGPLESASGSPAELAVEERRHIEKALRAARAALKADPDGGPALRALAEGAARFGDLPAGLAYIRRALDAEPESRATRFVAAELLRRDGKLNGALDHCRYILDTLKVRDPRTLHLAAEVCVATKRYDDAIALLRELIPQGEDEPTVRIKLAGCYLAKEDWERAVRECDRADRKLPIPSRKSGFKHLVLHWVRGDALRRLKRYDRAIVDFRCVASEYPRDAQARCLLGETYLAMGERDLAREAFLEAVDIQPDRLDAREELARLLASEGQTGAGLAQLRKAIEAPIERRAAYQLAVGFALQQGLRLAGLLASAGQTGAGLAPLWGAVEAAIQRPEAYQLAVRFALQYGLHDEAEKDLRGFLRLRPRSPDAMALAARLGLERGDAEEALALAYEARRLQPNSVPVIHLIARAQSALGGLKEAALHFAEAVRRDPQLVAAYLDWAAMHERAGQSAEAQEVYEQARKALPDDVRVRCAYARFCFALGRRQEGIQELRGVVSRDPRDVTARVALVEHFLERGESDAALAEARQAVQALPDSVAAQTLLAHVHRVRGEWGPFLVVLDHIAARLDRDAPVTYQRLAARLQQGRPEAAEAIAQDGLKRFPSRRRTIQLDLAIVRFLGKRQGEGLDGARQLVALDPFDADAGFALSLMKLAAGEADTQVPACRQDAVPPIALAAWSGFLAFKERRPTLAPVCARLLLEALVYDNAGWHDLAAAECSKILELEPTCLIARWLLPVIWERAGRRDKAIAACEHLVEKSPGFARGQLLLADLLLLDGKVERAKGLYAKAAHAQDADDDAVVKHALLARISGDSAAALSAWQSQLPQRPPHVPAHNNAAWLLATQPQPDLAEARRLITVALKLAPDDPAVLDSGGWVHYLAGKTEDAVRLLELAAKAAPYRALYQFHLGMAYARQRQTDRARHALGRAIELDPDGSFVEQARQALANLRF